MKRPLALGLAILLATIGVTALACGSDEEALVTSQETAASSSPAIRTEGPTTLRLGYFPNITHAQALVGVKDGTFQRELGDNVKLETKAFNAGPAVIEAMFAGEIDISYIGPNPAINGFVKSAGKEVRIVAGAASAGALFVVRPESKIEQPADMAGKKFATPQLGGTQDVALRAYVRAAGLKTKENGGNVAILPTANADTLTLFKKGDIDGAWVPEPWATRLVLEAGGRVFVDEATLWPGGKFVTTHVIVSADFLKNHPQAVEKFVRAHGMVTQQINADPEGAKETVNGAIKDITGAALSKGVIDGAWGHLEFTTDPIASSLVKSADDAFGLGFLGSTKPNLSGIYALDILNRVLAELKLPAVSE